jgi:hypothetical protein
MASAASIGRSGSPRVRVAERWIPCRVSIAIPNRIEFMISNFVALLLLGSPAVSAVSDTTRFGQGVDYRIEARLDESTDVLHARGELQYTNNAPVAVDTLWFHQHLNAFRPQSAWARRELEFNVRRFEALGRDQHAFERLVLVEIDGESVRPVYPFAPDSTVVGLPLPARLETGASATVRMDWEARLATTPRRQGRSGRHYDFAQWYPRIAVYDHGGWQTQPLLPQGEFFGEFGRYDVTLDLAADQVVGATGVPVEGDPGWGGRARAGYHDGVYQRDAYPPRPARQLGLLGAAVEEGRKRIRWLAEDVHHFAWSANPEFVYEGGTVPRTGTVGDSIAIHVLHWPTDLDWANGIALRRTEESLVWLQDLFGPYPWPQLTNLHRIESGGTEFPMMMMNGSPSIGLIMHEAVHMYLHGILANNEFAEGWLDEGFTSFITDWYHEEQGVGNVWADAMESLRRFEQAGLAQPIAMPGSAFRDMNTYQAMSYTKAALVFRMLRWTIGEEAMRELLRTIYDRHALEHFYEADLRRAASDVAGADLDWFFDQWLRTTDQLDYAIDAATTAPLADGRWSTQVEVVREGDIWMPIELRVGEVTLRLESRDRRQLVEVVTAARPREAVLDPDEILLDIDRSNHRMPISER